MSSTTYQYHIKNENSVVTYTPTVRDNTKINATVTMIRVQSIKYNVNQGFLYKGKDVIDHKPRPNYGQVNIMDFYVKIDELVQRAEDFEFDTKPGDELTITLF